MKRCLIWLLSILLLVSVLMPPAAAAENAVQSQKSPLILISGFMCSKLFTAFGTEAQRQIWGLDSSRIAAQVAEDAAEFLPALAGLLAGRVEQFGAVVGNGAVQVMRELRCLPDGSSETPVQHYPNEPATSNLAYMMTHDEGQYLYESSFCEYISGLDDPTRVYCFQYDSRLDAVTLAEELAAFIEAVCAATGSAQVRLFALSYGGLIVATYLTFYGAENRVERAVLSVPALGGTDLPGRILRGDIALAEESLVMFMGTALNTESNYARLFEPTRAAWLNRFGSALSGGLRQVCLYWGSIWCLMQNADYDALKAEFLAQKESAALIEKLDRMHYDVMPHLRETFAACRARGTQISILCGTGNALVIGGSQNGDMILPAAAVSGAKTAPLGQRFADGYQPESSGCTNPAHRHISPSMEVDASCAYLPENTWFIDGHYHGQYFYEPYTRSLVTKLLLTDDLPDVHADPAFPQFAASSHSYRTLRVRFDQSAPGYLSGADTALLVESLSEDCYIKLLSVVAQGIDLKFDAASSPLIAPGETVRVPLEGALPAVSGKGAQLTINYLKLGSANPFCTRTVNITLLNGAALAPAGGYVPLARDSFLKRDLPAMLYRAVEKCALRQSAECIYNTIVSLVHAERDD